MSYRSRESVRARQADRRGQTPVGFTMVEMVVALGVACLLMVGVVAFLVNGVVSTSKTTAINDTTTKSRYVFEHLSSEMSRSGDLQMANFLVPLDPLHPQTTQYSSFNYRINIGGAGTTAQVTSLSQHSLQVSFPAATAPDYLVPQVGDYLLLPYPNFGPGGAYIAGVSNAGSLYTLSFNDSMANLSGQPAGADVSQNEVATVQRQRSYSIQTDPNNTSSTELVWYPATATMQGSYVVANSLPPNQFPFTPQLKVPTGSPKLRSNSLSCSSSSGDLV